MIVHFIHRSGVDEAYKCPRSWYLTYCHAGTGIVRSPSPNYFDIGSAVHEGLATFLHRFTKLHPPTFRDLDAAIDNALTDYRRRPHFLVRPPTEAAESQLLIEALLRAWFLNGLQQFYTNFTVLHVEKEVHCVELIQTVNGQQVELHWMSRPDAIVREKYGPTVAGISWKTIDDANDYRRSYFNYDLQGLTEMFFGTHYLQYPSHEWTTEALQHHTQDDWSHRVDCIQTIFLQKGKRLKAQDWNGSPDGDDSAENQYKLDNFLLNKWIVDPHGNSIPFFNELQDVVPNQAWLTQYTKPRNRSYNRLSGVIRVPVEQFELAGWIERLSRNEIFPTPEYNNGQAALDRVVLWELPILRDDMHAEAAIEEIRYAELRRAVNHATLVQINSHYPDKFDAALKEFFPRSWGRACRTPVKCQFTELCYVAGPQHYNDVPLGFERRIPHHEPEALKRQQGLTK